MISTNLGSHDLNRCGSDGSLGLIAKPFSLDKLGKRVAYALASDWPTRGLDDAGPNLGSKNALEYVI